METPTILYLNNRYVTSLEELKAYFGSKLNEAQKGELIAAFRDKVLYDWLNDGGEAERQIAGDMLPILDQHLGNGEVLKKIAELFGVPNPLIADYKFVDHAEYLGCYPIVRSMQTDTAYSRASNANTAKNDVDSVGATHRMGFKAMMDQLRPELAEFGERMSSALKESTLVVKESMINALIEIGEIPQDLVLYGESIRVEKGQRIIKIVFIFKILSPENDYLTLRFSFNPEIENVMANDNLKLDLGGKKNSFGSITLEIDGEKLPKESAITIFHGNDIIGRVNFDNHENTDKVIEATVEPILSYQKASIVARAYADNGYVFFDKDGHDVLGSKLQLLTNSMYPQNNKEFEFGFYYKKNQSEKMQLFYVDRNGWRDLGLFSDAILLDENRVSVCMDKEVNSFYGIMDKNGHYVLDPKKYHIGKIFGISKNNDLVCETRPNVYSLFNTNTEKIVGTSGICIVAPNSSIICHIKDQGKGQLMVMGDGNRQDETPIEYEDRYWKWAYVYNNVVFASYDWHGRYLVLYHGGEMKLLGSKNQSFVWKNSFIQLGCTAERDRHISPVVIPLIKPETCEKQYKDAIVATKDWIVYQCQDYNIFTGYQKSKRIIVDFFEKDSINDSKCVFCISPSFYKDDIKCGFVYADVSGSIKIGFMQSEGKVDKEKELVGADSKTVIKQIVSYVDFLCVYYTNGNGTSKVSSIIVDREGKEESWENKFGDYSYYCGPFDGKFYYLSVNGDLFCKNEEENVGTRLSKNLSAIELYPLGLTKHFVIKTRNGEYQIVDNNGKGLSGLFSGFCLPSTVEKPEIVMDYIYNSQYLPIKNKEGKCGLIDTNGKIIVPCEYDEVEDLNSVFKREGIVVF